MPSLPCPTRNARCARWLEQIVQHSAPAITQRRRPHVGSVGNPGLGRLSQGQSDLVTNGLRNGNSTSGVLDGTSLIVSGECTGSSDVRDNSVEIGRTWIVCHQVSIRHCRFAIFDQSESQCSHRCGVGATAGDGKQLSDCIVGSADLAQGQRKRRLNFGVIGTRLLDSFKRKFTDHQRSFAKPQVHRRPGCDHGWQGDTSRGLTERQGFLHTAFSFGKRPKATNERT